MKKQLIALFLTYIFMSQSGLSGKDICSSISNTDEAQVEKGTISLKGKLLNFAGEKTYLLDVSDKAGLRVPENILIEPGPEGEFQVVFSLEEPGYYKLEGNTLYLSPGDNLKLEIDCRDRSRSKFSGTGSEACYYLKTIPEFSQVDIGYLGRNYENVMKDINEFISVYMLPQAERSLREVDRLKNVTEGFQELERARVKSNVVMSLMLYTAGYARKFVEGFDVQKHKDLFSKIREKQIDSSRQVLMKYGEGLAKAENIVLPEFRKILVWVKDAEGKELPKYSRIERIEDYELTAGLLQKYASCFTSFPNDRKKEEVLAELQAAKEKMSVQLYKDMIDKSVKEHGEIRKGAPVFDFTGYDANGNPVKLSQFKGKYIYLDFWATWCGPCIKEYPFFQELYHKYRDRGDIVFISVSTDQDKDKWLQYMKEHTHETISIHVSNSFLNPYKIAFIPRFMLIDKDFTFFDPSAPRPSQPEAEALLRSLK
jgi:thiol-disulfide isomerase/thioredoxin